MSWNVFFFVFGFVQTIALLKAFHSSAKKSYNVRKKEKRKKEKERTNITKVNMPLDCLCHTVKEC